MDNSTMFIEAIIDAVEDSPMLWNKACPQYYSDKVTKLTQFAKIASFLATTYGYETSGKYLLIIYFFNTRVSSVPNLTFLCFSGDTIEDVWNSLHKEFKNQFNLTKQQETSGSGLPESNEWVYYDRLKFLIKQLEPRQTFSTLTTQSESTEQTELEEIQNERATATSDSMWKKLYVIEKTEEPELSSTSISSVKTPVVPPLDAFAVANQQQLSSAVAGALNSLQSAVTTQSKEVIKTLNNKKDLDPEEDYIEEYVSLVMEDIEALPAAAQKTCFIRVLEEIEDAHKE